MRKVIFLLAGLWVASATAQTTMVFEPSKDNTIYAENSGRSNGQGPNLFAGRTQGRIGVQERRALLAFDVSAIPAGSMVTNVELQVNVNKTRAGAVSFSMHEVTADWGEGSSSVSGRDGAGTDAATGDATWAQRMFPSTNWSNPGGDFNATALTSTMIESGDATFPSSSALVDLVQSWVDGEANFGVILRDGGGNSRTVKRIASAQNGNASQRPQLSVTFMQQTEPMVEVPLSGLWFDAAAPGDGYNIIQSDGDVLTVFFFGYSASGERLWLVSESAAVGPIMTNQGVTLDVFEASGGTFAQPAPTPDALEPWGTLSITMDSCTSGTFVLSGTDGEKTSNIVKLVGIQDTPVCQDSGSR